MSGQEGRVCCLISLSRSVNIVRNGRLFIRDIICQMIRRSRFVRLARVLRSVVGFGSGRGKSEVSSSTYVQLKSSSNIESYIKTKARATHWGGSCLCLVF